MLSKLIGRWFRRHAAQDMPAQKGGVRVDVTGETWTLPHDFTTPEACCVAAPQPEIFEGGVVGLSNLCLIARAADNLECILTDMWKAGDLEMKGDEDSAAFICGALNELVEALKPYRDARDANRKVTQ